LLWGGGEMMKNVREGGVRGGGEGAYLSAGLYCCDDGALGSDIGWLWLTT
jgi:hypothetical protein